MGRQVGMVGSGLTNLERGISLLEHKYFLDNSKKENLTTVQEKIGDNQFVFIDIDKSNSSHLSGDTDCELCLGVLTEKENFVDIAMSAVSDYSFSTFEIGSIVDKKILEFENKNNELDNTYNITEELLKIYHHRNSISLFNELLYFHKQFINLNEEEFDKYNTCLLYTSDAADE